VSPMTDSPFPPPSPGDAAGDHFDDQPEYSADGADVLFGVSFDGLLRAQEFLLAINRLAAAGDIALRDAVLVMKDQDGKVRVRETIDPQPGRSALSGAMWSGLLGLMLGGPVGWLAGMGVGASAGAISARIVDLGVPDEWVGWFKQAVRPQTATVVVLAGGIRFDALYREANRFTGAELVQTTLRPGAAAELAAAFDRSSARRDDR
jgi:uncharacterized membrane protein